MDTYGSTDSVSVVSTNEDRLAFHQSSKVESNCKVTFTGSSIAKINN